MNDKLNLLAARREYLIAQSATQRLALAQSLEPWHNPLSRVDQGLAALRFVRSHPALLIGGGILIKALRPGRVLKWLRLGWVTWQMRHKLLNSKTASTKPGPAARPADSQGQTKCSLPFMR